MEKDKSGSALKAQVGEKGRGPDILQDRCVLYYPSSLLPLSLIGINNSSPAPGLPELCSLQGGS
jgi:hypothetical protein